MTCWYVIAAGAKFYEVTAATPGAAVRKVDAALPVGAKTFSDPIIVSAREVRVVLPGDLRPPSQGGMR